MDEKPSFIFTDDIVDTTEKLIALWEAKAGDMERMIPNVQAITMRRCADELRRVQAYKNEQQLLDVRNRSKEASLGYLSRAESTYLVSRGWQCYCGVVNCWLSPEDVKGKKTDYADKLISHEEAMRIQRERDGI